MLAYYVQITNLKTFIISFKKLRSAYMENAYNGPTWNKFRIFISIPDGLDWAKKTISCYCPFKEPMLNLLSGFKLHYVKCYAH